MAPRGAVGNPQRLRGLGVGHAGEKPQLDERGGIRILPRQFRHGRTTDRSLAEMPGRSAEPADSELGAMLRHLMGAGGAQDEQIAGLIVRG